MDCALTIEPQLSGIITRVINRAAVCYACYALQRFVMQNSRMQQRWFGSAVLQALVAILSINAVMARGISSGQDRELVR
jgi:hypothetical protein